MVAASRVRRRRRRPSAQACADDGDVGYVCGVNNPEDLLRVEGTPFVLTGNMGDTESQGGGFYSVDVRTRAGPRRRRSTSRRRTGRVPRVPRPAGPAEALRARHRPEDRGRPHRARGQPRRARVDRGLPPRGVLDRPRADVARLRAGARGRRGQLRGGAPRRRVRRDRPAALRAGAAERRPGAADRRRPALVARRGLAVGAGRALVPQRHPRVPGRRHAVRGRLHRAGRREGRPRHGRDGRQGQGAVQPRQPALVARTATSSPRGRRPSRRTCSSPA